MARELVESIVLADEYRPSVNHGYWYARGSEFLGTPLMQTLRWMRVPGDSLFAIGAFVLVTFVFTLKTGKAKKEAISREVIPVPAGD
jgi:nitric oxide reductase large subunit